MFTSEAQSIIELGKDIALTRRESKLEVEAIAIALAMNQRGALFLAGCLELDAAALRNRFPGVDNLQRCSGKLPLADDCREMLRRAKLLVEKVPTGKQVVLIALPHLTCAVALSLARAERGDTSHDERILRLLAQWVEEDSRPPSLGVLTQRLRGLRQDLLAHISGQDDAVHQLVEGLFGVEVVAAAGNRHEDTGPGF